MVIVFVVIIILLVLKVQKNRRYQRSRDGRSKSIGQYKLKTLLSLLPLLYRFSEGYSELLYLQRREENVQKPKIHSLT